jgi:hypothetical protein
MQEVRFKAALDALSDPAKVVLVTRPDGRHDRTNCARWA